MKKRADFKTIEDFRAYLVECLGTENDNVLTVFWHSVERRGNKVMDISRPVYEWDDMRDTIKAAKHIGHDTITVSSPYSGVIEMIHKWCGAGCQLAGTTLVYGENRDWETGAYELVPAIVLKVR